MSNSNINFLCKKISKNKKFNLKKAEFSIDEICFQIELVMTKQSSSKFCISNSDLTFLGGYIEVLRC